MARLIFFEAVNNIILRGAYKNGGANWNRGKALRYVYYRIVLHRNTIFLYYIWNFWNFSWTLTLQGSPLHSSWSWSHATFVPMYNRAPKCQRALNDIPLIRSFAAGDIDSHCCPSNRMSPCVILCIIKSADLKLRLLWNGTWPDSMVYWRWKWQLIGQVSIQHWPTGRQKYKHAQENLQLMLVSLRLPHTSRFFFAELQIFCQV